MSSPGSPSNDDPWICESDVTDRLLWRYGNRIDAGDPVSTFKSPSNLLSRSMRQRTRSFTAWFTALVLIVQSLAASALTRPLADARPGVVEGQVWVDMDNDGIYGPDEDALGGVRLSLRDGDMTIEEAVSSGSGVYRFIAVPAGEYQVVADLPEGYDVTLVPDESEDGALINEFSIDEDGRAAAAEIRVEDATTSEVGLGLVATAEDSAEPTTPTVPETTTTTAPPETTTTTLPSDVTVPPDTTTTTVAEEQLEAEELAPSAAVADEKVVGPMRFAEDGVGLYTGSIDWFEWGDAHGELIPEEGVTRTNTRNVAGGVLSTTCTLGPPTGGDLFVYRSGSFSGDAFDDMYNIGGVGANNELLAGLASSNGSTIQFSFDCSVTFNGDPVPLAGLVMADAEQSNSGQNEYVQATIGPEGTWRIIDR